MMTEFRVYELTREECRLYGFYFTDTEMTRQNHEYQMVVPNLNGPGWDGLRICVMRDPGHEELFVMATGWLSNRVRLQSMQGYYLSGDWLPISYFIAHPTDMETGFARFSTSGISGQPLTSFLVTARRSR